MLTWFSSRLELVSLRETTWMWGRMIPPIWSQRGRSNNSSKTNNMALELTSKIHIRRKTTKMISMDHILVVKKVTRSVTWTMETNRATGLGNAVLEATALNTSLRLQRIRSARTADLLTKFTNRMETQIICLPTFRTESIELPKIVKANLITKR